MARRNHIASIASSADAAALKTAFEALAATSGKAVAPDSNVTFSISATAAQQFDSQGGGSMVGYAYLPVTVAADGSITARRWMRAPELDWSITGGARDEISPLKKVPPGADRVICLPFAVVDSQGATTFPCGIFSSMPSTTG